MSPRRLTRALAAHLVAATTVVTVVATLALGAAPASAGSTTRSDPRADTWRNNYADWGEWRASDARPNADVRDLTLTHTRSRVSGRAEYVDLRRNGDYLASVWVLRLPRDRAFVVSVQARKGGYGGRLSILSSQSGKRQACEGKRVDIDYRADVLRWSVPRACVGSPSKVRFYGFGVANPSGRKETGKVWTDSFMTRTAATPPDRTSAWVARG